jgi:hypothetical protein
VLSVPLVLPRVSASVPMTSLRSSCCSVLVSSCICISALSAVLDNPCFTAMAARDREHEVYHNCTEHTCSTTHRETVMSVASGMQVF